MNYSGRIAVLGGGHSPEREISLRSAQAVAAALESDYEVRLLDPAARDFLGELNDKRPDAAFIAVHGEGGEDGQIQALLGQFGISYTGSGILASALAWDKLHCKLIWQALSLPTPDFVTLEPDSDAEEVFAQLGECVVKPVCAGSSYGISIVKQPSQLQQAYRRAMHYCPGVIAERRIVGNEYAVAIVDDQVLPAVRIEPAGEFYDYDAKYCDGTTRFHCPAGLQAEQEKAIGELSLAASRALDYKGWIRIDLLMDRDDNCYLIEANTVPGMTTRSLVPMSAAAVDIDFSQLVHRILDLAE